MSKDKILKELTNLFADDKLKPISFSAIMEHWQKNDVTNSSLAELLAMPTINRDKMRCFKILVAFIEAGHINDYTVNTVCNLVMNQIQLFLEEGFIELFKKLINTLSSTQTDISQEALRNVVFTLEYLFARGIEDMEKLISMLIKGINYNQFDENGNDALRCKLAIVYECNRHNYVYIGKELDRIIKRCIKADLVHCFGMLFFYYGIYSGLVESFGGSYRSKYYGWIDSEHYIKKARQRGFELAKNYYRH